MRQPGRSRAGAATAAEVESTQGIELGCKKNDNPCDGRNAATFQPCRYHVFLPSKCDEQQSLKGMGEKRDTRRNCNKALCLNPTARMYECMDCGHALWDKACPMLKVRL